MSDWQPIETAPKDETLILLFGKERYGECYDLDEVVIQIGYWSTWHSGQWRLELFGPNEDTLWFIPTHWMPLPPPPSDIGR